MSSRASGSLGLGLASSSSDRTDEGNVHEIVTPMTVIQALKGCEKSFYVKVGPPYKNNYFKIDSATVPFEPKDSLDSLVLGERIDLDLLAMVLKKCPNIENLKFFGIRIPNTLVKLIADNCPNLVKLELNPYESGVKEEYGVVRCVHDIKLLVMKCPRLRNLIIHKPSQDIVRLLRDQHGWGYDQFNRDFSFVAPALGDD